MNLDAQTDKSSTEIEQIKSELAQLKKGLPDRVTRIGAILGILTAAVGGVRGSFDLYKWMTRAPLVSMVPGPSLSMEYQPSKNHVKFEFSFSVANYGDEPNVVDKMDARLSNISSAPQNTVQFSSLDFTCSSGGASVPIPFPLAPGLPVTVNCAAESDMPEGALALLTQQENRLEVALYGQKHSKGQMPFCFFVPADVISEARASPRAILKRRFLNPQCS
jgi:hypothetical protein